MVFKTLEEILDFAIEKEQDSADFYNWLAEQSRHKNMQEVFRSFAKEELGHKQKIESVKAGKEFKVRDQEVLNLKLGDTLQDVEIDHELDYQEALVLAMKAEKNAFLVYSNLANSTDNETYKQLFNNLAQEEAKHKLRFEVEYDELVLRDN